LYNFNHYPSVGFDHPIDSVMEDLLGTLDEPALPLLQWSDRFSAAQARLPQRLAAQLQVCPGRSSASKQSCSFMLKTRAKCANGQCCQ